MIVHEEFSHLSNRILAHILRMQPRQLRRGDIQQALGWTLDSLGRDAIDPAIPRQFLEARIETASRANEAAKRGQRAKAHAELRRFWRI